jgi:hypothetical protein
MENILPTIGDNQNLFSYIKMGPIISKYSMLIGTYQGYTPQILPMDSTQLFTITFVMK